MDLDWLVFPSPDSSYSTDKTPNGEIIYIPKKLNKEIKFENNLNEVQKEKKGNKTDTKEKEVKISDSDKEKASEDEKIENLSETKHVPCFIIRSTSSSVCSKYALFYHGNAEDVNLAYEIVNHIRFTLAVNVIAPEYPGYGIYPGRPNEETIFEDTIHVYDYLTETLGISPNNIIVFGRSLGTGPGTYLASKKHVSALVLLSPMLSIRTVVKDILGTLVSYSIRDRFKNGEMIVDVKCPILIIHGQNDILIKYYHSTELYNRAKSPCELVLPENMDHNEFDFFQEFSEPLLDFLSRNGIFANTQPCNNKVSSDLLRVPNEFNRPYEQWNCLTTLLQKFSIN